MLGELNESGKKIYLVGCFKDAFPAETYPNIKAFPLKEYAHFLDAEFGLDIKLADIKDYEVSNQISICTGCIWNCAYCAIKGGVGGLKSRPLVEIEKELEHYTEKQYVLLMGEDTGLWGLDLDVPFSTLVEVLVSSKPLIHFDNMSTHSFMQNYFYLETLSNANKLKRIIIGVQHFNNDVLKTMNRPTLDFDLFKNRIAYLIKKTNIHFYIMSGFPSETKEHAQEQLKSVAEYQKLTVSFSFFDFHRKLTTNIPFPDIDPQEKKERMDILRGVN